jgi:hypothetical protein
MMVEVYPLQSIVDDSLIAIPSSTGGDILDWELRVIAE